MNPITAIVRLRRLRRAVTVPRRLRRAAIVRLRRNPVDGPVLVQGPAAPDLVVRDLAVRDPVAGPDLADGPVLHRDLVATAGPVVVRDPVATTGPVAVRDLAARTDSLTLAV